MIILFVILAILILVCAIKISNNNDLIANNCQSENDLENIKNAKKVFRKAKTYNYLLIAVFLSIIVLIICAYTDIDYKIIDFISIELVEEQDVVFDFNFFFLPLYIFVIREILIQVKIGEFLLKYFDAKEPELKFNDNIIKNILYKKPKQPVKPTLNTTEQQETPTPETPPVTNNEVPDTTSQTS